MITIEMELTKENYEKILEILKKLLEILEESVEIKIIINIENISKKDEEGLESSLKRFGRFVK